MKLARQSFFLARWHCATGTALDETKARHCIGPEGYSYKAGTICAVVDANVGSHCGCKRQSVLSVPLLQTNSIKDVF